MTTIDDQGHDVAMPQPAVARADGSYAADVVIIGAGLAGLYAAVQLPDDLDILVIDKGTPGVSGSSPWAQGGMAVALGPDDSPQLHAEDTVVAGDGLCDPAAVDVLTTEAPRHTGHLLRLGAAFDRIEGRQDSLDPRDLHLAREGGQSVARSVHTADASGAEMVRVLRDAAAPRVRRLATTAVSLARSATGTVSGVWVLNDGQLHGVHGRAIVLATGGCGGLFAATTNQDHSTGDGVALAYLAGAAVRDMEFIQFHPTGLAVGDFWRFLLTEALRGAGATLHAEDGTRFMPAIHPDAELAPRHVVAAAILGQRGGRAWLDATGIPPEQLADEFPTVVGGCHQHGFDLTSERVPVTPAAHYMMGGVRTDLWGRTSLDRLYAAGEVASTGLHGANRMAGNSLAEALVYGARVAAAIANDLDHDRDGPSADLGNPPPIDSSAPGDIDALRRDLRQQVWMGAGPVRDATSLDTLESDLRALRSRLGSTTGEFGVNTDAEVTELRLAVEVAELIRTSAAARIESRGGHVRQDHPDDDIHLAGVHLEHIRTGALDQE